MTKLEFLKLSFANQAYAEKAFCQSIISIQFNNDEVARKVFSTTPYAVYLKDNTFTYVDPLTKQEGTVTGDTTQPMFYVDTPLSLPGDFHPILKGKAVETTFGIFWFNITLIWEVFGAAVDYHNGEFTDKFIKGLLGSRMVDNPAEGEVVPEDKSSVDVCMKFTDHSNFLGGLGMYFIKAATVDSLTVSPLILKRKKELFEEHKADINDPVIFNRIVNELVQMDMKIQLSSDNKTFYITKKFIDNARKRMFIAFGVEYNAETNSYVGLDKSLDDGWDVEHMADYINTSIEGSYARGKATGEGGAGVKELIRLVGRSKVAEPDCGSTVGEYVAIDADNHKYWQGTYYLNNNKKPILITKENSESFIGKRLSLRAPQYCMTKEGDFCATCLGHSLGMYAERLSSDVIAVATSFMLARMKSMHISGSGSARLNLKRALKLEK